MQLAWVFDIPAGAFQRLNFKAAVEGTYVTFASGTNVWRTLTNSRVCHTGTFSSIPLHPDIELAVYYCTTIGCAGK